MGSFLEKLCNTDHFFYLTLTNASALTTGKIYIILNKLMWVIFGGFYFYCLFFLESFNLWHSRLIIALYHQTKTPISFWCMRRLNPKSLTQPSETLPIELTGTHWFLELIGQYFTFMSFYINLCKCSKRDYLSCWSIKEILFDFLRASA